MSYMLARPWQVATAFNLVQTAGTSVFKFTLPTGARSITVERMALIISTATGGTTSAAVKLLKGSTVVKTGTGVGLTQAAGVAVDDVVGDTVASNTYAAGDTLEIQIAVQATSTGNGHVVLWVS